ncbi:hypothetical protein GCM10011350_24230 [Marinomonas arctica]|nr:hypothetical protein GCM10011350_24230 [Marinomonas arctica]
MSKKGKEPHAKVQPSLDFTPTIEKQNKQAITVGEAQETQMPKWMQKTTG